MPEALTVAVTGPTGEIGRPFVRALERSRSVGRVIGMARRPFDPAVHGWRKTEYRQGDVLDRSSVKALAADADVVVHLAFIIMGGGVDETERVNVEGSRNVFEAALKARRPKRLVYTSSVAAYGFDEDRRGRLTEDDEPRGTEGFYYSRQKAQLERLLDERAAGSSKDVYVFRPCVVAGPRAQALMRTLPYVRLAEQLPGPVLSLLESMPMLRPVLPDPGVPFQLVHEDDVASALRAAVLGRGAPGVYNLAADGLLRVSHLADELGWYTVPLPDLAVDVATELVSRLRFLPPEAQWLRTMRTPLLMSNAKAKKGLGWRPKHNARQTLRQMVAAAREEQLLQ